MSQSRAAIERLVASKVSQQAAIQQLPLRRKRILRRPNHLQTPALRETPNVLYVTQAASPDVKTFREVFFNREMPVHLTRKGQSQMFHEYPAFKNWFEGRREARRRASRNGRAGVVHTALINEEYLSRHRDSAVTVELKFKEKGKMRFERKEVPLGMFIDMCTTRSPMKDTQIYLAQHPIDMLPEGMKKDCPTPEFVQKSAMGDVYQSSIWLGRDKTYTPLHKDPNPNFYIQLSGKKLVRMMRPDHGLALFEYLKQKAGVQADPRFMGEEAMVGPLAETLEQFFWKAESAEEKSNTRKQEYIRWVQTYFKLAQAKNKLLEFNSAGGSMHEDFVPDFQKYPKPWEIYQATIKPGEALFIPKGWWHTFRGVSSGVNGSINWWFR